MAMIDIPLPRLLNSSGGLDRELHPISVSLSLNITPLSTASIELPRGENLPTRAYVEMFSPLGSVGVFRVRSPEDAYGEDTTTAELEHAVTEVGDYLVKDDIDEMMAANTAMTTLFSHYGGSRWQLGSLTALGTDEVAVEASYDRLLDAMLAIMDQKPNCMMSFDFSTTPWTINIVARDSVVSAEGRLSRNVNSAKITYDDTELCTRAYYEYETTTDEAPSFYPVFDPNQNYSKETYVRDNATNNKLYQLDNGHTAGTSWADTTKTAVTDIPTSVWTYKDADTMSTYGLIERSVSTGSDYTAEEAEQVVDDYLLKHKHPRVSISVEAEELSAATGEPWDTFVIGKLMRLALADYGVTVEKTITGLEWGDVYNQPEDVTVKLAEEEDTAIQFLHDVDNKGGSGGGGGGKKQQDELWKEYYTKFAQDDYHFHLYAAHVDTLDNILQQAGLYIDANGVLIYAENQANMMGAKLKVESDRISLVVEGTGANAHIKPAAIVASINNGASTIKLSADHIDIDGLVLKLRTEQLVAVSMHTTGGSNLFEGHCSFPDYTYFVDANMSDGALTYGGSGVTWQSQEVMTGVTLTTAGSAYYATSSDGTTVTGRKWMNPITVVQSNKTTIHYLGKANT